MTHFAMIVWGQPRPKTRPRVTQNGTYTTAELRAWEKTLQTSALLRMRALGAKPYEGAVEVEVIFGLLANRGDLDNYVKAVLDALNKVVFNDDRQVARISAVKLRRPEAPFCQVKVTPLPAGWEQAYEEDQDE